MPEFVGLDYVTPDFEQESVELLEAAFPGWNPSKGNLAYWIVKAKSRGDASVFDMANTMSAAAFKRFGESVVGVPPIEAAPASAESTWTMVDNAGYTIPAGTQVAIEASGDVSVGFITVGDTVIAPAATTASVLLQAVEVGEAGNGLTADPELIDALAFVDSIELVGTTANGVDEEDEDAYLDRLVETLRLLSLSLIVPPDFEIDARAVAGIARAKCIPGYRVSDKTENHPLEVAVFPVDEDGQPLSAPVKEALEERQQGKVPSGVLVHVGDPTYTAIDVDATVVVQPGFDPATVVAAVAARLAEYLDPAKWGLPRYGDAGSSGGWENATSVYRFELVAEVDRVGGVDRVASLRLGGGAAKAFTVAAVSDKLSITAHGYANGDAVVVRPPLTNGAPLAAGTIYYVRDQETNAFKLAATEGGAAIDITTAGSGTVSKIGTADLALAGPVALTEPGTIKAV